MAAHHRAGLQLRTNNKGEDGVELVNSKASTTTTYRLWPYLQERQPTILFGPGDNGKSFFGVLFGYLIATGREHLGMKPEQGNVCYLDYETDEATTLKRLSMVAAGFGEEIPPFFHYMHMPRPLEDDFDRVNAYLMKHSIDFVVIDSPGRAVLEPEASGPVNQYFNALAGLEATTLTIAHVSKTGKESEPFGSIFWYNGARAIYRAFGKQVDSTLGMGLRNHKANNGPRLPDQAYEFTFHGASVNVTKADPEAIRSMDASPAMHKRVETYLANNGGPVSASDLAKTLDATPAAIRLALNRELKGKVQRLPDGTWALARIHRRTAFGTALEEAIGCSSESGIMVLEQEPARKQGAPNRCRHRTIPTVSASSLTTIAWWPMPACSCRPPSPGTWACGNSSTITLTSAARRDGRTLGTRC